MKIFLTLLTMILITILLILLICYFGGKDYEA